MTKHHFTLDVDWCSDDTLEYVADLLQQAGKKATWFATHKSPGVDKIFDNPNYEAGLHPNFLEGSTHGTTESEVLEHITALFPDIRSMRTHGLYQSSNMLNKATSRYGIGIDVSLLLPYHANLAPLVPLSFGGEATLIRIPYFWEDDLEMFNTYSDFNFKDKRHHCEGLKIYDFHPVHIALNIASFDRYKLLAEKKPLPEWDRRFILRHQQKGKGTLSFFEEMLEYVQGEMTVSQIAATYNNLFEVSQ